MKLPPGLVPRQLLAGPVLLDLFHRDGCVHDSWMQGAGSHGLGPHGTWLRLHPREFGLLWRLAESPRTALTRATLLRDVWRLHHDPPTNTLEVHIFRLRQKLAAFGVDRLVVTDPAGGYRLEADARPVVPVREALDSYVLIGNGARQESQTG